MSVKSVDLLDEHFGFAHLNDVRINRCDERLYYCHSLTLRPSEAARWSCFLSLRNCSALMLS